MTELFDDASCVSFPSGGDCEPPSPSQCSWPANPPMDPGLFQAQLMGVAYYGVLNQWRQAFDSAGSLAALQIGTITDAFPSKSPQVIPLAQLLSTLGAAFGAAGSALSIIPDGEFAGGATGIIGGILSTIGGALPSSDPSDNTQNTLSNYMSLLYTSTWTAIDTMANNIFKKGDVSSFPKSVITGPWTTPMANYFYNGKWFYPMDTSTTEDLGYTMNRTIQQGLVGATLGAADYFILAVTVSESDCDQITSGTIIDGLCYFLAFPGSQECNKDNNAIDSDTVKTMATYGVKPSDVIENSVACQKQTDNYFGTLPLAFTPESWGTGNPICFYNLPVFKVQVGLTLTATEAVEENPCDVYKSNLTATSPVTGLTWLPPNLASIFNDDWCYCVRPCPPYC
ncbi:hypothetical protein N7510_010425 [Penicillium lagena]|uniref:uncharacterized protein n=1 Tax=Penicillium lagena TaxID=94218 RepID=UPI00253FCDD5|nr:uncharacterized protein N7510_010425 [Penicillium lagena]KAJ5605271.1 hypothetical protein N7510_010425 [Penicillium lagena]